MLCDSRDYIKIENNGAQGRIRTTDTEIFSPHLFWAAKIEASDLPGRSGHVQWAYGVRDSDPTRTLLLGKFCADIKSIASSMHSKNLIKDLFLLNRLDI